VGGGVTARVINADVLDGLRTLPDRSVQCAVTSPPYHGLRDYSVPPTNWEPVRYPTLGGQVNVAAMACCLGLEPDPSAENESDAPRVIYGRPSAATCARTL
jgi:hypothetical protein